VPVNPLLLKCQVASIANTILVRDGSYDLLLNLAGRADVAQITANHKFQLEEPFKSDDPGQTEAVESNITFVKAPQVWALGFAGQGTVMAGNDTGLDWDHPALIRQYRGCLNPPTCSSVDHNYNWWDATGTYPSVPGDGHGHGTHTSGTMVGEDASQTNQIGMAPDAALVHCKNMTDGGSGDDNTFLTCFQWDLAPWDLNQANPTPGLAPDAINNSWGYWGGGQNQFRTAINNLQDAGIAVEVSAGNEGSGCGSLRSPGDYTEVLTTGSVNHASSFPGTMTDFSSRGPSSLDGNYFPDITAPGENIRSSVPGGGYEGGWSGTSMSGPHATALIGLMWSACPTFVGRVEETYFIITSTAVPVTSYVGSCGGDYVTGPNNDWGYGTIDALAAVQGVLAQCGPIGSLEGYVYDDLSSAPIAGAAVTAESLSGYAWSDTTDATGYYSFSIVPEDTYTVTAEHVMYTTGYTTGVEVVSGTVTQADVYLTPRGLLFGYVTDYDNGTPIEGALVTAEDGTWAETDAAGYYEMYLDEGTYVVTATATDYASESATVVIVSGANTQEDFALQAAVVFIPSPVHVTVPWQTTDSLDTTILNRMSTDYAFEFVEAPGGFIPLLAEPVDYPLNPSVVPDVPLTTGLAPAGYVPQAGLAGGTPEGHWEGRATAPFVSMDNVYLDYEGLGYLLSGYGANGQVGIYDPNTNTWTTGAAEPSPQIQYPIDGCLGLNAGGEPVGILFNDSTSGATTLHRYNIATNVWDTPPVPAGFPANGLWGHDVVSMLRYSGQNVCYISGGATTPGGGNTSALYAYYPDSNTAVDLGDYSYLAGGFAFHASWYAPWVGGQGGICVGGGVNASSVVSGDTQCYDIGAAAFNATNADLGAMPAGVWGMADDVLYEGGDYQLWLANGADTAFALWPNSAYYSFNDGAWYIGPTPPTTVYRVEGVNISAADGCSFYVVGGSSGGFTPTSGHNRNFSADCPPTAGADCLWLSEVPTSTVVPAEGSFTPTLLFDATYGAGVDQPGDYYCTLNLQGDPAVKVLVTMTVLAGDLGQVHGYVMDNCTGEPVEADIAIAGGVPITMTTSDPDTGYYSAWLEAGTYDLTFTADGYLDYATSVDITVGGEVVLDVSLIPDRPCIGLDPEALEVWVMTGTAVYEHPTGLDIINNGGQDLEFALMELPDLPLDGGGVESLSGSFVVFDPSVGGDENYIPGTAQTFCFRAESFTNDWEYVYNTWLKFPTNWTVSNVYVQGTPVCDSGSWGTFSWAFQTSPYEVNITHARYMSTSDHCTAYYCAELTSAPAGTQAPVSWFWDGDGYANAPHWPCSNDGYAPAGFSCDEAIQPPAYVPIGAMDVPWFWESPVTGTVPALTTLNDVIYFTALYTDATPMPLGDYNATLIVTNNADEGAQNVPVLMHIIDQLVTPTADFDATTPACAGEDMWFYFTGDAGVPPADQYTWWFGDGISMTVDSPDPVAHAYADPGTYTVTLEVCNTMFALCDTAEGVVEVLALPEAGFSYAANGLEVTFTDESQYATEWWWDFGDGVGTSTETNPVYTYLAEGTYTVTQYVYNDCGEAMAQQVLTVAACDPAEIVTVTEEISGCVVTFVPELAGTAPLTWLWDFGAFGTSTETSPVVDFGTSGTYPYTLTAENACGADEWVDAVTVECCAEVEIVTYTYEIAGCVVDFGLELTGDEPFTYLWAFGDGMTSTLAAPTYTYLASGTYNVTVDVYNCAAGHDMASFEVTVQCGYSLYLPLVVKVGAP